LAFQVIAEDDRLSENIRIELVSKLAQAAAKMVVGQQLDLEAEGTVKSLEEIEYIHRNKTGALIRFSAEAGAIIADASSEDLDAISSFGEKLGLLFQVKDDLLDVTKTTEELGKTAGKDTAAAKATYPAVRGIERTELLAGQLHGEAKDAISTLGDRAAILNQIADFILRRNA
ncbi:MAG: polyprenyl synthetase family protein, partial [Acidobacteriota bacterium]